MENEENKGFDLAKVEDFQRAMNKEPSQAIIKRGHNSTYIPVSEVENLLDTWFFGLWSTENLQQRIAGNEVIVSIELNVWHPNANIWLKRSGIGASVIQQDKGAKPSEFDKKKMNALETAAPKAKAAAIKNAAKSLGKLFGRDLSRKADTVAKYKPLIASNLKVIAEQNKKALETKAQEQNGK